MIRRKLIEDVLMKICIPTSILGFKYIVEAIVILDRDPNIKMGELYCKIAEKCQSHPSRVERVMRHAFGISRSSIYNGDLVEFYIGLEKVSNTESLHRLYYKLERKERELTEGGSLKRLIALIEEVNSIYDLVAILEHLNQEVLTITDLTEALDNEIKERTLYGR